MDIMVNPERDLVGLLRRRHLVDAALLDMATRGGDFPQALDTLVEQGMVRAEQLRRMVKTLGKVVGTCFTCLKRVQVPVAQWDGTFFCEHCYARRSLAEGSGCQVGDLLLDAASRLLDEHMLRALVDLDHTDTTTIGQARKLRSKQVPRPTVCGVLLAESKVDVTAIGHARSKALGFMREKFPHLDSLRADHAAAKRLLRSSLVSQEGLLGALKLQYDRALKTNEYVPLSEAIPANELTDYQRQVLLPRIIAGEAGEDAEIDGVNEGSAAVEAPAPAPAAPPPAPEPAPAPAPAPAPEPEPAQDAAPTTVVDIEKDDAAEVKDVEQDDKPSEGSRVTSPRKGIGHGYAVSDVNVRGLTSGVRRLHIKLLKPDATLPAQPKDGDAGIDLHATGSVTIEPGAIARVPLGFATEFTPDLVGLIRDRSSMAARGLHTLGGVIDSSYRGEWIVLLTNLGQGTQKIEAGDRVAQVVFVRLGTMMILETDKELSGSERGEGGFGSSGK